MAWVISWEVSRGARWRGNREANKESKGEANKEPGEEANILRNKEFRRFVFLFIVLAAAGISIGFFIHPGAGFVALALSVVLGVASFAFTKARYLNLKRMSESINLVLHNTNRMELDDFDEGELSILHSEITKMTLRIREQNEALIKDKQFLADSLADIAHQLRTPLTSANLLLSILATSPNEIEQKASVHEVEALLLQMDWLITSLLKLSRLDAGVVIFQKEPLPIQELIHSALYPLLIPMELRNIDLRTNIPDEAVILGDKRWLSEAVQNVLKNCMENAGENGFIEISCEENVLFTELSIHDSGAGFEKNDLPRIFERFYRGESVTIRPSPCHTADSDLADASAKDFRSTGYGIGLALSKTIITDQGGSITAKNHPDGGALFKIRFPK